MQFGVFRLGSLIFLLASLTMNTVFAQKSEGEKLPSEAFKTKHSAILAQLDKMDKNLEDMSQQNSKQQRKTMQAFVGFIESNIIPHAESEEEYLYRAVNKRVDSGSEQFTSTMSEDHKIVKRWTEDLKMEASKENPDHPTFSKKGFKLLGLISAHFEKEEKVLLPILDRTMTWQEFENEVMSKMAE